MRKPKHRIFLLVLMAYMLLALILPLSITDQKEPEVEIIQSKAGIENEGEDLQSRWAYEQAMLADPRTGEIPGNYRQLELAFSKELAREERIRPQPQSVNGTSATANLDWVAVGPNNFGGRTRALALDVRNENTLLAGGVSGGMWKSVDAGQSWQKATTNEQIHSVSSLAQDIRSGKENVWYYGTGELVGNSTRAPGAPFRGDGIFKSLDNGDTWTQLPSTAASLSTTFSSPLQYVWDIETDPDSGDDVILAAIWGGVVRSADGGNTWTTVLGRDLLSLPPGSDLNEVNAIFYTDIHRTSDNTFYASLSSVTNSNALAPEGGLYRSDDGINWVPVFSMQLTIARRTEITSSQSNPNLVYFFSDEQRGYRLRSYNRLTGQIVDLSENLPVNEGRLGGVDSQDSYNMLIQVHPTNPDVVFLGGTNLFRSTDGFRSPDNTTWIGGYDPVEDDGGLYPNHHPDQHELIFIPSAQNAAYSANDGGVFRTNDILASEVAYTSVNNDFVTTQFYAGTFSQFPPDDFVFGGAQDNGTLLAINTASQNGQNGVRVLGGDGAFTASSRFGVYYYMSSQNARIFRLTLGDNAAITSFARVDPVGGGSAAGQSYLFINPYILDPNNGNRMYLAGGSFLWRNRNLSQIPAGTNSPSSANWSRLDRTVLSEGAISALQASTTPRDIVYYGTTTGRLFRVDAANGEEYVVREVTGASFPQNGYIRSLAIDPTDADRVLVSFSNYNIPSLFLTEDGGQTYTDVSGTLEENPDGSGSGPSVRWVTIVPKTDGSSEYFVGTSIGLFSTQTLDGSSTQWSQAAHEEIGNVVVNMIDYRRNDGKIMVATHGSGMFTSQLENVLPFDEQGVDSNFTFSNAYPNPFDDFVTLQFDVPETDFALLRVYDSSGRLVYISSGSLAFEGENEFFWEGANTLGQPVPNGVYIVRLTYRLNSQTKKVLLNR